jgi:hypothetical protein
MVMIFQKTSTIQFSLNDHFLRDKNSSGVILSARRRKILRHAVFLAGLHGRIMGAEIKSSVRSIDRTFTVNYKSHPLKIDSAASHPNGSSIDIGIAGDITADSNKTSIYSRGKI